MPKRLVDSLVKKGWTPTCRGDQCYILRKDITQYISVGIFYYQDKNNYMVRAQFNYGKVPNLDLAFNDEGYEYIYVYSDQLKDLKQLDQQIVTLRLKFLKGLGLMRAKVLDNTK